MNISHSDAKFSRSTSRKETKQTSIHVGGKYLGTPSRQREEFKYSSPVMAVTSSQPPAVQVKQTQTDTEDGNAAPL